MPHYWKVSRRAWAWSEEVYRPNPDGFSKFKRHLRWAATFAIRQAASHKWFTILENPAMRPFLKINPRLAFRPMGGYLSWQFGLERRTKIILNTYQFIHEYAGPLREAMARPDGMVIARVKVERGGELILRLRTDVQFRKEGEISVFLELTPHDGCISALSFSLEYRDGLGWVMYVGVVQGRKGGDEEVIKLATKAIYGLRPKSLAVFVAQEIARSLRIEALLGVSNGIHVFRAKPFYAIGTPRKIRFDYDELWIEHGGEMDREGWFHLPLKAHRRTLDEIKPNKRSMYSKRYAFLDELSRQIKTALPPFPRM